MSSDNRCNGYPKGVAGWSLSRYPVESSARGLMEMADCNIKNLGEQEPV